MKRIDIILNAVRFSVKELFLVLFIIFVLGTSIIVKNFILSYEPKNDDLKSTLNDRIEENESFSYVEDILEEHYENLEKYKSIDAPDLFGLQEEIEGLIPRGIQLEETKIDSDEILIRGLSPNLRTIDFLISILNTYNNFYGGFDGEVTLVNTTKKDTLFSFTIKGLVDQEKIKSQVISGDMDGDGVIDSLIEEVVSSSGVKQKKSIINDFCPFTPKFNIVIGKLLESNPSLIKTFPYYEENYNNGYFSFNSENGCLAFGDTKISFEDE